MLSKAFRAVKIEGTINTCGFDPEPQLLRLGPFDGPPPTKKNIGFTLAHVFEELNKAKEGISCRVALHKKIYHSSSFFQKKTETKNLPSFIKKIQFPFNCSIYSKHLTQLVGLSFTYVSM